MGRLFLIDLEGERHYSCKQCDVALALYSDVISKASRTRNGHAYVFRNVVNVTTGEIMHGSGEPDIFCVKCGSLLGFQWITAVQYDQMYYLEYMFTVERDKLYGHYILTDDGRLLGTDDEESGESDKFSESGDNVEEED